MSSLRSKCKIGSNAARFAFRADEVLTKEGIKVPSRRNGPMKSVMVLVNRNGTLCPSSRPKREISVEHSLHIVWETPFPITFINKNLP